MALINTLRNKMGKIVVAFIAVAMFAFILSDFLFSSGSNTLFGNDTEAGEIAGESIDIKELQAAIQERENDFTLQNQRQPSEREKVTIRNQAWELLITKYAFHKQYEKTGVEVTGDEMWDMMQGKNMDENIRGFFRNPETNEFDRQLFLDFLNNYESQAPLYQNYWRLIKNSLKPGRERLKYENLLLKSIYTTNTEALREYNAQNDIAEIKYLYVPNYAISDSAVSITESEMKAYYEAHKDDYKTGHTKSLQYVTFPVIPSSEDSLYVKKEIIDMMAELKSSRNDSLYATANTDGSTPYGIYNPGNLPSGLTKNIHTLGEGFVVAPILSAQGYTIHKISKIYEDTVYYAKASHILIKAEGDDDSEAKKEAQDILNQIKSGADFAQMAKEHGTDGTASRGGDLGWFKSGDMVEEFNDAVMNASKPGLLNNLVKTDFGYHIIKIDEPKTNIIYKIATIERDILPGDETRNEAFRKADLFKATTENLKEFEENVAADSTVIASQTITLEKNDRRVGILDDARQIVQWLFRDASVGDVSDVYDLDNQYVIAVMTRETKEGYQSFEAVKNNIEPKVKDERKAKMISEQLKKLSGTLDEIATAYGSDANIYTSSDLKLSALQLPNVGTFEPAIIGKAFSLKNGERSEPLLAANGVVIIEMLNLITAPEIADYSAYKNQLDQGRLNRTGFNITEAIKEDADIEDNRYKFY